MHAGYSVPASSPASRSLGGTRAARGDRRGVAITMRERPAHELEHAARGRARRRPGLRQRRPVTAEAAGCSWAARIVAVSDVMAGSRRATVSTSPLVAALRSRERHASQASPARDGRAAPNCSSCLRHPDPRRARGQITARERRAIQAKLIVEGANGPTTREADDIFERARHHRRPRHPRQRRRRHRLLLRVGAGPPALLLDRGRDQQQAPHVMTRAFARSTRPPAHEQAICAWPPTCWPSAASPRPPPAASTRRSLPVRLHARRECGPLHTYFGLTDQACCKASKPRPPAPQNRPASSPGGLARTTNVEDPDANDVTRRTHPPSKRRRKPRAVAYFHLPVRSFAISPVDSRSPGARSRGKTTSM